MAEPAIGDTMAEGTGSFFAALNPNMKPRKWGTNLNAGGGAGDAGEEGLQPKQALEISGRQTQDAVLWLELGLCKALTRAVTHMGFIAPTPVQAEAIPVAMTGVDMCVRAVTGSGKTAAFVLPVLHRLLTTPPQRQTQLKSMRKMIRALVLVPSRELGVQCEAMIRELMQFTTDVRVALAIGGIAAHAQEAALEAAPELVVATPGRLSDLLHNYKGPTGALDFSGIEVVVLDECDKMLTVTIKDQVEDILSFCPSEARQTLLFSATMTSEVDAFAKQHLFRPHNIDIGHVALASQLRQQFVRIKVPEADAAYKTDDAAQPAAEQQNGEEENEEEQANDDLGDAEDGKATKGKKKAPRSKRLREKLQATDKQRAEEQNREAALLGPANQEHIVKIKTRFLAALCAKTFRNAVIIFTKYRTTAHRLCKVFNHLGMPAAELHGNQTQEERFDALRKFASREVPYLFSTDIASRGLDIKGIETVINFDLPPTLTAYIHRVGRTARIGDAGTAVSLVHETQDAEIMRKILAISGTINDHTVASVKRRDVPDEEVAAAAARIDAIFPAVREELALELTEEQLRTAEKKLAYQIDLEARQKTAGGGPNSALHAVLTSQPRKAWALSAAERKKREEEARRVYEKEAEVVLNETQAMMAELDREEQARLKRQRLERRQEREKKQQKKEKVLAEAKAHRKEETQKLQKGLVRKMKQKKVREARKEARAESRVKKGASPYKKREKKSAKKSRHRKRPKKH